MTAQVKRRRKNDHWIRKTSIIAILYDHDLIIIHIPYHHLLLIIIFQWSANWFTFYCLLGGKTLWLFRWKVAPPPPNPDKNIADKILALLYLTPSHSSPVKWSSCCSCLNSLSPFSGFEQNCVPGRFVTIWLLIPVYLVNYCTSVLELLLITVYQNCFLIPVYLVHYCTSVPELLLITVYQNCFWYQCTRIASDTSVPSKLLYQCTRTELLLIPVHQNWFWYQCT